MENFTKQNVEIANLIKELTLKCNKTIDSIKQNQFCYPQIDQGDYLPTPPAPPVTPVPEWNDHFKTGPFDYESTDNESNDNKSNDNESNDNELNDNESNDNKSNDNESNDNESNDNESNDAISMVLFPSFPLTWSEATGMLDSPKYRRSTRPR